MSASTRATTTATQGWMRLLRNLTQRLKRDRRKFGRRKTAHGNHRLSSPVLRLEPLEARGLLSAAPVGVGTSQSIPSLSSEQLLIATEAPAGLSFTSDQVEVTSDGTLLLLNRTLNSIFRWDPSTQSYGPTIPLLNEPDLMAYSAANNTIYVSYVDGRLRQISLDAAKPIELPFAFPGRLRLLSVADGYVVIATNARHATLRPDGTLVDTAEGRVAGSDPQWNSANQKLYFVDDQYSVSYLISEQINADGSTYPGEPPGGIGNLSSSFIPVGQEIQNPVRVSPDGRYVVLGSGALYDANRLIRLPNSLSNSILDAVWLADRLFTFRQISNGTEVQEWNTTTFELLSARHFAGKPSQLRAVDPNRLVCIVADSAGVPEYHVLDTQLNVIRQTPGIVVTQTYAGTVVSEDGATDTIQVVLSERPASNVTVRISSRLPNEVTTSVSTLTFTSDDWNQFRTVEFHGVNDSLTDGDMISAVTLMVDPATSDVNFATASPETVFVLNLDDEVWTGTPFLPAIRFNNSAWFVSRGSGRIERFDMNANQWLDPLVLPGNTGRVTAASIDSDGIFLAFGTSLYRYSIDGVERRHLRNESYEIANLSSDGDLLFLGASRFVSLRKSNNEFIEANRFIYFPDPAVILPQQNLLIGFSLGSSNLDAQSYTDSGRFDGFQSGLSSGNMHANNQLWASPSGSLIFNSIGEVYSSRSLSQTASIGTNATDMDFLDTGAPVVVSGNQLTAYSESLLPIGSLTLARSPQEIFVFSGSHSLFTFLISPSSPHRLSMLRVDLSQLRPEVPATPVYRAWVRARLADSTTSPWSGPLRFQIDVLQLLAPVMTSTSQTPYVS